MEAMEDGIFLNYSSRRTLNWWMWPSQYLITSMGCLLGTHRVGRSWSRSWLEKFEGDWDWRLGDQIGGHLVTWLWSDVSLVFSGDNGNKKGSEVDGKNEELKTWEGSSWNNRVSKWKCPMGSKKSRLKFSSHQRWWLRGFQHRLW